MDRAREKRRLKASLSETVEVLVRFEGSNFQVGSKELNNKLQQSDRNQNLVTRVCLLLN